MNWIDNFHEATLELIGLATDYLKTTDIGTSWESSVSGVALDICPWHEAIDISIRLQKEARRGTYRYNSADWKHCWLLYQSGEDSALIRRTSEAMHLLWENAGTDEYDVEDDESAKARMDMAHLLYIAAAEALLKPNIAEKLRACGIDAPIVIDQFYDGSLEYIVADPDEAIGCNYCDYVLANRIFQRACC